MKKIVMYFLLAVFGLGSFGCTDQQMARQFGGTAAINIPADRKLVNVTWKGDASLWLLTRERVPSDTKEIYYFTESSSFGIMQGVVVIKEK